MCQPGLTVANFYANCRKCLTEQIFSSPLAWVVGSGIIRPNTNAPHWVQKAGLRQPFVASAQKVMFHGEILHELGVVARYHGILLLCPKQRSQSCARRGRCVCVCLDLVT